MSARFLRQGVALLALIGCGAAPAQSVPASALLRWTLPTKATDGSNLEGAAALTKVQVFVSTSPIADTSTAAPIRELGAGVLAYTWTGTAPNGATIYARVKACNAAACSEFSAQGSTKFQMAAPAAPGAVSVTIKVQAAP